MGKKGKRKSNKYPALKPELNLKSRYELIDYDYIDKLSEEEKDFLNRFSEEYINANFNHEGKVVHKPKYTKRLIKSTNKEMKIDLSKKDSYDRNNARNKDIYTKQKSSGGLLYMEEDETIKDMAVDEETKLNDQIDFKRLFSYPNEPKISELEIKNAEKQSLIKKQKLK